MGRRSLQALVGLLVVLVVVAGVTLMPGRTGSPERTLLYPGLEAGINDISQLKVTTHADTTTSTGDNTTGSDKAGAGTVIATLERGSSQWTVKERHGYPADIGRVRRNLLALANARIIEQKTSNPAFYERLGVQDPGAAGSESTELAAEGTGKPVELIVGSSGPGGSDSTYVRRAGEAVSWLVSGRFDPGKKTGDWLDPSILDIPASRIASVSIIQPDGTTLQIVQTPAPEGTAADPAHVDFDVVGMPKGRSLKYPGMANGVAGALAELNLEDVAQRDSLGQSPGKPVVARFTTTDGLVVEVSAWRLPAGTLFSFNASAAKPEAAKAGTAAAGKGDSSGGARAASKDPATEANAINARLAGWLYSLPGFKAEQFTRTMEELLAPK